MRARHERALLAEFSLECQVSEQLVLLHVCLHLVAHLVQNQAKLENVLPFIDLNICILLRTSAGNEMLLDLWSHIGFSTSNWREPRNLSGDWTFLYWRFKRRITFLRRLHGRSHVSLIVCVEHSSQSKVPDFRNHLSSILYVNENVIWFKISVNHIILVNFYHPAHHLAEHIIIQLSVDHPTNWSCIKTEAWKHVSLSKIIIKRFRAELHLDHHINRLKLLLVLQEVIDGLLRKLRASKCGGVFRVGRATLIWGVWRWATAWWWTRGFRDHWWSDRHRTASRTLILTFNGVFTVNFGLFCRFWSLAFLCYHFIAVSTWTERLLWLFTV